MSTAVAPVVVSAQNGRMFRMTPQVLACAHELLAGSPPAAIAEQQGIALDSVLSLYGSLLAAEVEELSSLETQSPGKRFQVKGISALQLTLWYPGARFVLQQRLWSSLTGKTAQQIAVLIAGVGIIAGVFATMRTPLPSEVSLGEAIAVLIITLFLTSIHELGHVFSLGAFGVAPRRVGVMLFYGSIAMFSDVTPAWELGQRRDRLRVIWWGLLVTALQAGIAGGIYLIAGSTLAGLIFFGLLAILMVNLVPLARFDGYYLYILATDQPRLRDGALTALRSAIQGAGRVHGDQTPRKPLFQLMFGVASILYGCLLWAYIGVQTISSLQVADGVRLRLESPPLGWVAALTGALALCYVVATRLRAPASVESRLSDHRC